MNSKIIKELNNLFMASPQLMRDNELLSKAVNGTFGVSIKTNDLFKKIRNDYNRYVTEKKYFHQKTMRREVISFLRNVSLYCIRFFKKYTFFQKVYNK